MPAIVYFATVRSGTEANPQVFTTATIAFPGGIEFSNSWPVAVDDEVVYAWAERYSEWFEGGPVRYRRM